MSRRQRCLPLPRNLSGRLLCRPCQRQLGLLVEHQQQSSPASVRRYAVSSTNIRPNRPREPGLTFFSRSWLQKDEKTDLRDRLSRKTFFTRTASSTPNLETLSTSASLAEPQTASSIEPPHRKRRRRRQDDDANPQELPPDASSQLSALSSQLPKHSFRQRFFTYLSLSKPRLSFLIVLTTAVPYAIFPVAVSPFSSSLSLSPLALLNLTTGTALSCACANALNMLLEPEHDAKMTRTRSRPLVRGLITRRAALVFAVVTGAAGLSLLYAGVNPTVAFLSALNIALYAGAYTPLKRISVANTWVGALVGGIPPLMGWAAAAAQASPLAEPGWRDLLFDPETSPGGWIIAGLLFAWQFPHFNSLSYSIRNEYAAAGYKMLVSFNPRKNALVALRYSLAMVPLSFALCYVGVTNWAFAATSSVANGWLIAQAWRFWQHAGAKGSARGLFWASVWHLPLILVLAMVHKKGIWERLVHGGLEEEDLYVLAEEEEEEEEGEEELEPTVLEPVANQGLPAR